MPTGRALRSSPAAVPRTPRPELFDANGGLVDPGNDFDFSTRSSGAAIVEALQVRGGYRHDLEGNRDGVASAGFGTM